MIENKTCSTCKLDKPRSDYNQNSRNSDALNRSCRECQSGWNKRKQQNEDDPLNGKICPVDDIPLRGNANRKFCSLTCKHKVKRYRQEYGLDIVDYRTMVAAANGICPICLLPCNNWNVDHNHLTGEVTGVVCSTCNIGALAHSKHDVLRVERLLEYLKNPPSRRLGINARSPDNFSRVSQLHKVWRNK